MSERDRYERVWAHDEYRRLSPGERSVPKFLFQTFACPGDTVLDAGCGTGRAGLALKDAGLNVTLADFVRNSRDPEAVALRFIEADLSQIIGTFDWIYCADVMEHIPPTKVERVLRSLLEAGRRGCWFEIACRADSFGAILGVGDLHLTVESPVWWKAEIERIGATVRVVEMHKQRCILLARLP